MHEFLKTLDLHNIGFRWYSCRRGCATADFGATVSWNVLSSVAGGKAQEQRLFNSQRGFLRSFIHTQLPRCGFERSLIFRGVGVRGELFWREPLWVRRQGNGVPWDLEVPFVFSCSGARVFRSDRGTGKWLEQDASQSSSTHLKTKADECICS